MIKLNLIGNYDVKKWDKNIFGRLLFIGTYIVDEDVVLICKSIKGI